MKDSEFFRKLEDMDTITDEDILEVVRRLTVIVARYRKARGEHELKPTE